MKKLIGVVLGIVAIGAFIWQPYLLIVAGGIAFIGGLVYGIGVYTNDHSS